MAFEANTNQDSGTTGRVLPALEANAAQSPSNPHKLQGGQGGRFIQSDHRVNGPHGLPDQRRDLQSRNTEEAWPIWYLK